MVPCRVQHIGGGAQKQVPGGHESVRMVPAGHCGAPLTQVGAPSPSSPQRPTQYTSGSQPPSVPPSAPPSLPGGQTGPASVKVGGVVVPGQTGNDLGVSHQASTMLPCRVQHLGRPPQKQVPGGHESVRMYPPAHCGTPLTQVGCSSESDPQVLTQ